MLNVIENITERKKTEEEVRTSRQLLKTTIDSTPDMIQVFEAVRNERGEIVDFRYILVNEAAEKWMPGAIGKSLLQRQPGVLEEGIFAAFKEVAETGIAQQYEKHYVHEQFNGWFHQSVVKLNDGVATTTSNITERKIAEEQVKTTKESLRATLDSSLYFIQAFQAVRDESGKIIDFTWIFTNNTWNEQYGDAIGKSLLQQNPGVIETGLFEKFIEVTESGITIDHEQYYSHEQFNEQWFHQTLVKMGDGFVMNTEDITERKKSEHEIRESKNLIQTVFDVSLNPIAYHKAIRDGSGKIIDFEFQLENREARKYAVEDRKGQRYSKAYPGIKDTAVFRMYCDVVETGKELNTEVQLNLKGKKCWFHLMAVKLHDGLVATAVDITEQKEAHEEILRLKDEIAQKATDKYKALFDSIDEGFAIQEVVADERGKVIDVICREVNRAFEQLTGMKDALGKKVSEAVPHIEQAFLDDLTQVYQTGKPLHSEGYTVDLDRWFSYHYSQIGGAGSPLIAVVFNDISPRKRREEQQEYLLLLNDALRPLMDPVEVQRKAMEVLGTHLKVDRVVYSDINIDGDYFEIHDNYAAGSVQKITGRFPYSAFGDSTERNKNGETLVIHDVAVVVDGDNEKAQFFAMNVQALVAVPLIKNGKLVMNLSVHQTTPRKWRADEIVLIEETAERTWAAVERAKAEEALRRSEERINKLISLMPAGVYTCDAEGRITYYNRRAAELWGREPALGDEQDKFCGAFRLWQPDGSPIQHVQTAMADAVQKGESFRNLEVMVEQPQGTRLIANVNIDPLFDSEGKIAGAINVFVDITNRKEAEEKLRNFALALEQQVAERTADLKESAAFVQEISQTTPDRITIHDAETREILFTNHPHFWQQLYENNETYQQAKDKRAIGLVHPDEAERFEGFLRERNTLTDGVASEIKLRLKGDKWVHIRSKIFKRDAQGKATQLISFTTDITVQKKAELEVQKNLAILQHTEELAQTGSWEYDIATGHFTWSEGMYRLFGLPQGMRVKPEIYLDVAVEEDRPVAKRIIKNLKKAPQSFEETMKIRRGNSLRLLRIKGSVVKDEAGHPQKLIGVDLDITDIKEAEKQAQESRHWLEQTAEASPDSITVYNLVTKQPVYLNSCLAKWTGKTREELVAMGIEGRLRLLHPDDRLRLLHFNELIAAAKDGEVLTLEYRLQTPEGNYRWLRNRSKIFMRDAAGKVTHLLSILQDISTQKAAELQLHDLNASLERQNRELEAKNDEITSFAFVASHDLKEPIRKIHTFSDWLLQNEGSLSETGLQHLHRLHNAVKRLDTLVEDIVALTKVHVEKEDLQEVSLSAVLEQTKADMQESLESTGAEIMAGPLPTVKGVENHLFYLFKNLLSNSLKFQPAGARPVVHIQATHVGNLLKISFTDNGIGFAPAYSKKIFQMFRRLHGKTEFQGTGMGLAICKRIMEKHGGTITAESSEGKGATFTCWFPAW